jgi:hypothetical protein
MQEYNFYKVVPTTYFIVFLWERLMAVITKVSLLSLVPEYTEEELEAIEQPKHYKRY